MGWPNQETKRAYEKKWRDANRERVRAYGRAWHAANPLPARKRARLWAMVNPEKVKQIQRRRYGHPEPTRDCPEVCELCGAKPGKKPLSLDHCHTSGKFRGWLCMQCNLGLGHFKDNRELMLKAIEYLKAAL